MKKRLIPIVLFLSLAGLGGLSPVTVNAELLKRDEDTGLDDGSMRLVMAASLARMIRVSRPVCGVQEPPTLIFWGFPYFRGLWAALYFAAVSECWKERGTGKDLSGTVRWNRQADCGWALPSWT